MPKSMRTQIIEKVVGSLEKIQAGHQVPNLTTGGAHRFLSSVRSVNRRVAGINDDQKPALYVVDPVESGRHLLADILAQTMQLTVAGLITSVQHKNATPLKNIIGMLDDLVDDTRAVLVSDPQWGGLARKSRLTRVEADSSVDGNCGTAAFGALYEIDYIETVDSGEGTLIRLPDPLPVDQTMASMPYGGAVMNAMFNAYLTIPGLVWVERPRIWPLPVEQVSARYTPSVWFHETGETFEYQGSRDTKKQLSMSTVLLAVEPNEDLFDTAIDYWVGALKNCLGSLVGADLQWVVATVDIQSIRTEKCEYPVILIELDSQLMYIQSFVYN
jgi:hypothetical protein